jgi:hypothetical protein
MPTRAKGLIQKILSVAQRGLGVLIDSDNDCLEHCDSNTLPELPVPDFFTAQLTKR